MKEWPGNGEPVRFQEIIEPLLEALRFGYKLERQNEGRDIPWNGFNIGKYSSYLCGSPEQQLTATELQRLEEGPSYDLAEVLMRIAVQLGIEQGRRLQAHGCSIIPD